MSGLLLDTHALIWAIGEPTRLGELALPVLRDPATMVHVSAASVWEISTKHRIGKLPGADVLLATLDADISRLRARSLPISARHALLAGALDWDHRDPFDRMLAAQAILESLTLVTVDDAFQGIPSVRTLW